MSNYTRKAKRNKERMLWKRMLVNRALVYWQKQLVCPYNHQLCEETTCEDCFVYEQNKDEGVKNE